MAVLESADDESRKVTVTLVANTSAYLAAMKVAVDATRALSEAIAAIPPIGVTVEQEQGSQCRWVRGKGDNVIFDQKLTCSNPECECR